MAATQALYKCAILLALVTCLEVLHTEGRKLRSMNKPEINSIKEDSQRETPKHGNHTINLHHNTTEHKEEFQPTPPSHIPRVDPSVAGKKEVFPPVTPKSSFAFGDSNVAYKDDFRPTTPGNSPGVGHSFEQNKEAVAGFTDDFRPTVPGRSPGVGHPLQNKNEEPNA